MCTDHDHALHRRVPNHHHAIDRRRDVEVASGSCPGQQHLVDNVRSHRELERFEVSPRRYDFCALRVGSAAKQRSVAFVSAAGMGIPARDLLLVDLLQLMLTAGVGQREQVVQGTVVDLTVTRPSVQLCTNCIPGPPEQSERPQSDHGELERNL